MLALAAQEEPPRTVNNQILGTAEEFAVRGPARVCLWRTSLDLIEGETAFLHYLGIHAGGIRVRSPNGVFRVTERDAWAAPRRRGRIVSQSETAMIVRQRRNGQRAYLVYGTRERSAQLVPVAWVEGGALTASDRDLPLLTRIDVNLTDADSCTRRFLYGWDFILGSEQDEQPRP